MEPTPLNRKACITYLQTHGIYSGHSRDSVEQLRQLVAGHKATGTAAPLAAEGAAGHLDVMVKVLAPAAAEDKVDRLNLAKSEHKLLQAWIKDGSKPPRPATPNLDALEAEANGTKPKAARKATGGGRTANLSERHRKGIEAKRAAATSGAKRGPGRKVTQDELVDYIRAVLDANPDANRSGEMEYAYWVDGIAFSRARWNAAWDAASAS
jgi:hypothetical protein